MKIPNVNVKQFKQWCVAHRSLAEAVCMATAFAQMERERVNAYVLPIFAKYRFKADVADGRPLERPDQLYLSADEALCRAYFDECDAAHRAHGFTGPKDHCPALQAENLQMKAERALIQEGAKLFGIEDTLLYGDNGAKFLKLLMGACLQERP